MKWAILFAVVGILVTCFCLHTGYAMGESLLLAAVTDAMLLIIFGEPIDTLFYPERHQGDEWSGR